MAGETTTTSAVDSQFPKWFDSMIEEEIRPLNFPREFFKYRGRKPAPVFRFTFLGDPGAAAATAEGSAMSNTQLSTSGSDVTAGTIGMMATITQEHDMQSLYTAYGTYGAQLIRSLAEKFSTDACGVLDDFTNSTGTSGADLTTAQILEASTALSGRDAVGQVVGVLHTQQIGDLKQDLATSVAAVNANPGITIGNVDAANLAGYQGTWHGIPFYQTSLVNTANGGADRKGAIFIVEDALGLYEVWGPQSETDRDISLPGDEVAVTQRYGVGKIRDNNGQCIATDA